MSKPLPLGQRQINRGLRSIASKDVELATMLDEIGFPKPRIHPSGFETFLSTIVGQQISTQAARTINARVKALMEEISAEALLSLPDDALRGAGLSQRKLEYAKGLAEAVIAGHFDPDALHAMSDDDAIAAIIELRGFGVWSAEIYLMFSLGRPDIFPADDLIIRVALTALKSRRRKKQKKIEKHELIKPKDARALTEHWAPFRSAGALFLWHMHHEGKT